MARKKAQNKKPSWILVCDASRARLLRESADGRGYELLEMFEHPDSRARSRDLMADANGRKPNGLPSGGGLSGGMGRFSGGPSGGMGRPGAAPDTDPKAVEALKFARHLAEVLEKGRVENAYESVVLAAPPKFLGLLKGELTSETTKLVEHSIDKDYSWLELHDLQARLDAELAA